jgi:hypothetical protein
VAQSNPICDVAKIKAEKLSLSLSSTICSIVVFSNAKKHLINAQKFGRLTSRQFDRGLYSGKEKLGG